ncbi:GNAT family N-acetyltransferase [Maricaulis salignorans]|uniref:GNAT family N-acetyltransferase n=1 Tax=Maricaulis salignorans TaxID=144026 RepID=UPI003A8E1FC4
MAPTAIHLRKHIDPAEHYEPCWPQGVRPTRFDPHHHARAARALLNIAYTPGGGDVIAFQDWWPALTADPEYRPDLCFIALDAATGEPAGFAQCWSLGFIKDIAVKARWRGRGLGRALMLQVFATFQARGIYEIDLKVAADNPSGAARFYAGLGMVEPG